MLFMKISDTNDQPKMENVLTSILAAIQLRRWLTHGFNVIDWLIHLSAEIPFRFSFRFEYFFFKTTHDFTLCNSRNTRI